MVQYKLLEKKFILILYSLLICLSWVKKIHYNIAQCLHVVTHKSSYKLYHWFHKYVTQPENFVFFYCQCTRNTWNIIVYGRRILFISILDKLSLFIDKKWGFLWTNLNLSALTYVNLFSYSQSASDLFWGLQSGLPLFIKIIKFQKIEKSVIKRHKIIKCHKINWSKDHKL
jgi:hypothetical protein